MSFFHAPPWSKKQKNSDMIFGSFGEDITRNLDPINPFNVWGISDKTRVRHDARCDHFLIGMCSSGAPSHDAGHALYRNAESRVTVAVYGTIFNASTLAREWGGGDSIGEIIHAGYQKAGSKFFAKLNGNFVIAIHDPKNDRFWVARDHLGVESLFFYRKNKKLHFCSKLHPLAKHPEIETGLNPTAVSRYLLFNYNPAYDSFYQNIEKLRPGNVLKIEKGKMHIEPYWYISFKDPFDKSIETYREELLELFRDAIKIRLDDKNFRTGAYLSGGMDSSTVVGLMRPMIDGDVHTFSFRCRGKSYDESKYARLMSDHYKTQHHEVPYESEHVDRIMQLAGAVNEPFSDIGIEVASFLLAEKASGVVDYVLTGDGGDELFGGHPVYLADRMAEKFEKVPSILRNPMTSLFQKLPDTDQKKSLVVKAKRFSYSAQFPAELYSNRWRIYYTDNELRDLLHPDWRETVRNADPLHDIKDLYTETDGEDFLSKTLYGDYYTVVGFYLSRMELVRNFGLEGRIPMLDHRLVEYTARIPSNLKIGPKGETKDIFHKVMAGTLPDEIVFRTDKLGHSVPFKNWLRDASNVQKLLKKYTSPDMLKNRGMFNPKFVERMYNSHMSRAENNSHRLWAILVFELWCQRHLDGAGVEEGMNAQPA